MKSWEHPTLLRNLLLRRKSHSAEANIAGMHFVGGEAKKKAWKIKGTFFLLNQQTSILVPLEFWLKFLFLTGFSIAFLYIRFYFIKNIAIDTYCFNTFKHLFIKEETKTHNSALFFIALSSNKTKIIAFSSSEMMTKKKECRKLKQKAHHHRTNKKNIKQTVKALLHTPTRLKKTIITDFLEQSFKQWGKLNIAVRGGSVGCAADRTRLWKSTRLIWVPFGEKFFCPPRALLEFNCSWSRVRGANLHESDYFWVVWWIWLSVCK